MDLAHTVVISLVFPTFVYLLTPKLLRHFGHNELEYKQILILACLVMFVSWYLPSPLIEGKDTSFTTHFLGGGIFCGLLWFYVKKTLRIREVWYVEVATIYALTCSLGVANELFELLMYKIHIMDTIADTSWDLLANTLGAFTFYVVYRLWRRLSV